MYYPFKSPAGMVFAPFSDIRTSGVGYSGLYAHASDFDFWSDRVEILRSDLAPAEKARKFGDLGLMPATFTRWFRPDARRNYSLI